RRARRGRCTARNAARPARRARRPGAQPAGHDRIRAATATATPRPPYPLHPARRCARPRPRRGRVPAMSQLPAPAPARLPRGWLVLALLAWGVCADTLAGAAVMALLLAAVGAAPVKWQLRTRDFHRAADLTTVVFALTTVAAFQRQGVHGIYEVLRI